MKQVEQAREMNKRLLVRKGAREHNTQQTNELTTYELCSRAKSYENEYW